ncbi:DUF58 domain-containing protein [Aliikangiella maris]|uniref:DUF58 domain-containing protein n=2 Tax=Aliikangiella maris TaxID=3162458 RepID=A0ABV3MTJ5_9GAMM
MKMTKRGYFLLSIGLLIAIFDGLYRMYLYQIRDSQSVAWIGETWFIWSIILVALFVWAAVSLRNLKGVNVTREIAATLPVNCFSDVALTVNNQSGKALSVQVFEHTPDICIVKNLPAKIKIDHQQYTVVRYQLKAIERGDLIINRCELWVTSDFGLLTRRVYLDCKTHSKIYPNYRSILNYILLATEQKTQLMGIRQRQLRGDGLEFHQLREYRMGDNLRQIDWRATSRLHKLISKDYQQERDQNIIFLLDSGRRMRARDGELSHFDQALNAMLLVASIALRQGDAVGLKIFGGDDSFILPKKGSSTINALLNNVYGLHPTHHASDLVAVAQSLSQQFKKRSLVVIISNARVEDELELKTAVNTLKKHHLVMLANMREQVLMDVLEEPVLQLNDAFRYAQTSIYLAQREKLHQTLIHDGIVAIDSVPGQLAINMVNQYFEIKRSGRL